MNEPKNALVTGASGGIGEELARLYAADDYHLVLVARSRDKLDKLADELSAAHNIHARVIACDLSHADAPQQIFDELQSAKIHVDALVNNAGFGTYGAFDETSLTASLEMLQLNIVSLTHLTKLFLPDMLRARHGQILNVASTAAFQPGPLMAVYYASKAYVLSFSEALANELHDAGIVVSTLCPGPTQTGFQQRAAMGDSKLVSSDGMMDARTVAVAGYRGMLEGRTVVIPGFKNRLLATSVRFAPRSLITKVVRRMQEQRGT